MNLSTETDFQYLPYQSDSTGLMRSIATLSDACFLNSRGPSPDARWEIFSALPVEVLTISRGRCQCTRPLPANLNYKPFDAIEWLLSQIRIESLDNPPNNPITSLPFTGGAIGFMGYPDNPRHYNQYGDSSRIGIYLWAVVIDHQTRNSCLFFLPQLAQSVRHQIINALRTKPAKPQKFRLLENFHCDVSAQDYRSAFLRIKAYLREGDCYQVNLARRFSSRFEGDPFEAYLRLLEGVSSPMCAFLRWDNQALLSLSPERFLRLQGRNVVTEPIKGTRRRGTDIREDYQLAQQLQRSEKDKSENLMIVDLLRNDLSIVCKLGSVRVEKLFELRSFQNVHHLVSSVHGELDQDRSPLELLKNCFPGGSVTGAPKMRAMEIIDELENFGRGPYCGSVFYLSLNGNLDSNIAIRTLYAFSDRIYCWGGGGIVDESDCELEYQESQDKIHSLIQCLQSVT